MSPFGSNFHHDSFEWVGPPPKKWDPPTSLNYRSNTNINIDFNGLGNGIKSAAKWNFLGNVLNNITNLGTVWMLSKGNEKGATILNAGLGITGSIFSGGFGFGGRGYGGGYGMGTGGYGGSLADYPYTYVNPRIMNLGAGLGGLNGIGGNGQVQQGGGNGQVQQGGGNGQVQQGGGNGQVQQGGGNGQVQQGGGNGQVQQGSGNGQVQQGGGNGQVQQGGGNGQVQQGGGNGDDGDGKVNPKAEILNKAINDTLDANGDGKVDNKDIFSGDAYNTTHGLQHTTSKDGEKDGIKKGIAKGNYPAGESADTKTKEGFYKYITVTDKTSGNQWTFEFVKTSSSGDPIYKFSKDFSDLSKDDKNNKKGFEPTGQEPEYTVTVDKDTKQIKFETSGNLYAASEINSGGIISQN